MIKLKREELEKLNTKRLLGVLRSIQKEIDVTERYGLHSSHIDNLPSNTNIKSYTHDYLREYYNYKDSIKEILSKREHIEKK